ncbi:MAG: hypothetical protein QOF40_3697 [Actinomycetota bacterium]|jgi:hypothetical protein|nr:hypothetical protein [Actinomycetota bacterium]
MSSFVDYRDHYAYFDDRLSFYNFLRFDDRHWRRFNPTMHFQNRLRHRDYRRVFREAGFEIVEEDASAVQREDLVFLEGTPLAPRFAGSTTSDLAIQDARFVLKKT